MLIRIPDKMMTMLDTSTLIKKAIDIHGQNDNFFLKKQYVLYYTAKSFMGNNAVTGIYGMRKETGWE
jgi:hypothetical protein